MDSPTATFSPDLSLKISSFSGEVREASVLFQRVFVSVQRFFSMIVLLQPTVSGISHSSALLLAGY